MIAALLAAAACNVSGTPPFVRPDPICTPGAYEHLSRPEVCTHKPRPPLPSAERRWILVSYGIPDWTGRDGEIDHRVAFFLGGTTDRRNLWPQIGRVPNAKDALEAYTYRRVCTSRPYPMRVGTARAIFMGDWVVALRKYRLK
jgi:hypothetical protein